MNSIMNKKAFVKPCIYIVSILIFLLGLQICSSIVDSEIFFPSIFKISNSFFVLLKTGQTYIYILNTLKNLLISLLVSFIIGGILGVFGGLFKTFRIFIKPWMTILRCIPLAGCIVILMILAGLNKTPYVVCSIMLIPIIYEGISQGIQGLDPTLMDVWKLNSGLNFRVLVRVHLPLILSFLKTAFISAVGIGIKIVIMAEYLAGVRNTLGYAILPATAILAYDTVFAYCLLIVILVVVIEQIPLLIYKIINQIKYRKKTILHSVKLVV